MKSKIGQVIQFEETNLILYDVGQTSYIFRRLNVRFKIRLDGLWRLLVRRIHEVQHTHTHIHISR